MTASLKITGLSAVLESSVAATLANIAQPLATNICRGGIRAGAQVIADAARDGCRSKEVAATIGVSTRIEPGVVIAKVQTKGPGAYKAPWLESGTDPHFISVDSAQSGGRTIKRINSEVKRGSLVIGGKFVGETVHHPGAEAKAFMRPAADTMGPEAGTATAEYIAARLSKEGLLTPAPEEEPDE